MEYQVKIDAFEGPLDLLLHLIKKLEIDIYDIPVAVITEQYLDFIHQMQTLELDVASEYLVMAATLIEMKSRMLLPKPELLFDEEMMEEDYEDDPREALIRRLVEYRQYKEAAEVLKEKEEDQAFLFSKRAHDLSQFEVEKKSEAPLAPTTVYDMLSALQHLLRKKHINRPLRTKIERQTLPVGERMRSILSHLRIMKSPQPFASLFPYPDRTHIVVTFLALLELMKLKQIHCEQEENFEDITISLNEGGEALEFDEETFRD
ncbi:segregation/condensation protein A [Pullulanibacillus sp. KACC 23026]|uniref:segregation/condensation protein A n=1 Tax=Pullulanibacillus sp. KACC 23026 TaxID=3028315 RepID=UPI0023AF3BC6|nr:segregation/condensation protein A [Pullulanibacillus sp. KACC 23026]WEG11434.1 segregation/condensation protein A [Pullulanibacillus sp. KACC 23026]